VLLWLPHGLLLLLPHGLLLRLLFSRFGLLLRLRARLTLLPIDLWLLFRGAGWLLVLWLLSLGLLLLWARLILLSVDL